VLDGAPVTLVTLAEFPPIDEPEETGATFAENARLKARYYARASAVPTVAEDSGLAIDALGGRPGIHSARYPGETYDDKFANLYRELAGHPQPWTARFVCALAFVEPRGGDVTFECEAAVRGEVTRAPQGSNGFGYDPIFFYPPYGKTLGAATDAEKLVVSHRGQAFRTFRAWLDAR
jgi:XTP/dITP diphosphohydrolase